MKALYRLGIPAPGTAILETIGRKSGEPRRTPVTNGLDGDVFWIVTEHGHRAAYVLNIEANPRVRIRTRRGWRSGTAAILPDDDPRERLRYINSAAPRHAGEHRDGAVDGDRPADRSGRTRPGQIDKRGRLCFNASTPWTA